MRSDTTFVVEANSGKLYVAVKAIMTPILVTMGFVKGTVTFKGNPNKRYLEVAAAIAWCQEEMLHHSRTRYEKLIRTLRAVNKSYEKDKAKAEWFLKRKQYLESVGQSTSQLATGASV